MADVNDPSNIAAKVDREWSMLEDAAIDDADRNAIRAFVEWRRDSKGKARNTLKSDLGHLRRTAERAETPLLDMSRSDVDDFFTTLQRPTDEGGYGLDDNSSSIYAYKRVLVLFFRYLDEREVYDDYPFHDSLEIPSLEMEGSSSRDEMLTGEDIEALKDAATNPRDRALIALLGDIGGRITLALSLRVDDVHLDGEEPYLTPNDEVPDGLKKIASSKIPILHARGELRTYLRQHHPDPDTDRAPLWPLLRGYDHDNPQECAVSDDRVRNMLTECRDRAGIGKDVDPHNFRRTAATRLSNSDRLEPQEIKQIMGWSKHKYHKMLEVYDYTSEDERNSTIHQSLGLSDGEAEVEIDDLSMGSTPCGSCGESVPADTDSCPRCGEPADVDARKRRDEIKEALDEFIVEADDRDKREFGIEARQRVDADPSFAEEVAAELDLD